MKPLVKKLSQLRLSEWVELAVDIGKVAVYEARKRLDNFILEQLTKHAKKMKEGERQ